MRLLSSESLGFPLIKIKTALMAATAGFKFKLSNLNLKFDVPDRVLNRGDLGVALSDVVGLFGIGVNPGRKVVNDVLLIPEARFLFLRGNHELKIE